MLDSTENDSFGIIEILSDDNNSDEEEQEQANNGSLE